MSNATFTFGRFNPPTEEGHGKLVSAVQKHAEETGGQHYIFPTHSQDKKKNPMSHEDKVGAMHKLFPNANVVSHDKVRTVVDAMKHLEKKGHTNVTMVVGSDRVDSFHKMLNDYRTKEYPKIKKVNVVSAGHRDPDAEGAEGMSASKLRGLVSAGKKKEFVSHYSDPKLGAHIHDKVKAGMQMESTNPVGIFLLGGPGSGKDYVLNNIFSRFDLIEVQVDQIINGSARELVEQKKNIVINGAIDADKMAIVESILGGYDLDAVYVSVTNKVSRLRNALRDNPLNETKRIQKFLAAEKLAESIEGAFVFNNSINLNESTEFERVFFGSQIEKLLARLVEQGLKLQETPEPKSFSVIKEKYSHSPAQQAAIAIAMKKAGKKPMKEDIRYAERTQFPPIESLRLHAERIAEKHSVSPAEILDQLATGISVEYVQTRDHDKATELAVKNLENQCDYYSKGTTVKEQLQPPKVPAMRYVPTEAEKVKASEQRARKERVRHRWFDHRSGDIRSIARKKFSESVTDPSEKDLEELKKKIEQHKKDHEEAAKLGADKAKQYMHNAGDTGNPVQEEVWDEPNPKKTHKELTPSQKARAKARAEKAGRRYPNMVDNIWAAQLKEEVEPKDQKSHLTVDQIAKKHDVSVDEIQKEFEKGQKVEHEHTQDADRAADIALNHLGEIPDYYSRLDKMEKQGKAAVKEDVNTLFERQFDGTSSYREYAIAMTPGQSQEIKDVSGNTQQIDDKEQCGCTDCDCNNVKDSPTGASGDRITRSLRNIKEAIKEKKGEEKVIDVNPIIQTKRKKGSKARPHDTFDSTLQGMPTVSTAFAEAAEKNDDAFQEKVKSVGQKAKQQDQGKVPVTKYDEKTRKYYVGYVAKKEIKEDTSVSLEEAVQFHVENNVSFTENIFRPGSDMFFSMINEAKRLYKEGSYTPADEYEKDLLESDIGEKAMFEGQEVILDFPFEENLNEEDDPTGGHGIGKPFRSGGGGAVYVRTGDGGVRKVNFSQSGMKKRYMEPGRVRSFMARHHCLTNNDKTSASYWACRWPRFFSNSGRMWW